MLPPKAEVGKGSRAPTAKRELRKVSRVLRVQKISEKILRVQKIFFCKFL